MWMIELFGSRPKFGKPKFDKYGREIRNHCVWQNLAKIHLRDWDRCAIWMLKCDNKQTHIKLDDTPRVAAGVFSDV
jgi:hypothetical protein